MDGTAALSLIRRGQSESGCGTPASKASCRWSWCCVPCSHSRVCNMTATEHPFLACIPCDVAKAAQCTVSCMHNKHCCCCTTKQKHQAAAIHVPTCHSAHPVHALLCRTHTAHHAEQNATPPQPQNLSLFRTSVRIHRLRVIAAAAAAGDNKQRQAVWCSVQLWC